jgi:hypothetical protein
MFHIITPFSRNENLNFYIHNLQNKNIIWHPIVHEKILFIEPWILTCYVLENLPKEDPNYFKLNKFIEIYPIEDNDWYCFMNDDDWMEDNVIEEINKIKDHDVVFCSMKRGHQIPNNEGIQPHGIETLIAKKGVGCGQIGLEQIFLKGKILKQIKFDTSSKVQHMSDGVLAEELQKKYTVKYLGNVFVLFNYLEPGRWNREKDVKDINQKFNDFVNSQQSMPLEFIEVLDENFWELVGRYKIELHKRKI